MAQDGLVRDYAAKLPPEVLAKYRRTFDQFDRNGGGDVDVRELGIMFRALRQFPTDRELRLMIDLVDEDHSGTIDFNEFCGLMLRLSRSKNTPRWLRAALTPPGADADSEAARSTVASPAPDDEPADAPVATTDGALDLSSRLPTEELQLVASDLLCSATHLSALSLSRNALTNNGAFHLAAALARLPALGSLALVGCALRDAEVQALAAMLRANASIRTLDLRENAISDEGARTLAHAVKAGNRTLRSVRLEGNAGVTAAAHAALQPVLLRNSLADMIGALLPEVSLANRGLLPMHARAIRTAMLPAAAAAAATAGPQLPLLSSSSSSALSPSRHAAASRFATEGPHATSLDLSENPRFGDAGARTLFGLRHEDLLAEGDATPSGAHGAQHGGGLAGSAAGAGLLGGLGGEREDVLTPGSSAPRSIGASIVAAGPGALAGRPAASPPAAGPHAAPFAPLVHAMLIHVTQLALDGVGIGDDGVRALADALGSGDGLPRLRELSLRGNVMGADARALGRLGSVLAAHCAGVREFRLSRCPRLSDDAVCALLSNWLPAVARSHSRLAKAAKGVGARAVDPLHLFLGGTRAADGAAALVASALGAGLCLGTLSLGTGVGDAGASALGKALSDGGVVGVLQVCVRLAPRLRPATRR